jgi:hypothetical protein
MSKNLISFDELNAMYKQNMKDDPLYSVKLRLMIRSKLRLSEERCDPPAALSPESIIRQRETIIDLEDKMIPVQKNSFF